MMVADYSYIGVWNMEYVTSESVVFSYEPEESRGQGFHWHCENNEIELELVSQCIQYSSNNYDLS